MKVKMTAATCMDYLDKVEYVLADGDECRQSDWLKARDNTKWLCLLCADCGWPERPKEALYKLRQRLMKDRRGKLKMAGYHVGTLRGWVQEVFAHRDNITLEDRVGK